MEARTSAHPECQAPVECALLMSLHLFHPEALSPHPLVIPSHRLVFLRPQAKDLLPQQGFRTTAIMLGRPDRTGTVPSAPPLAWTVALTRRSFASRLRMTRGRSGTMRHPGRAAQGGRGSAVVLFRIGWQMGTTMSKHSQCLAVSSSGGICVVSGFHDEIRMKSVRQGARVAVHHRCGCNTSS
jgi:hypothetical protein